MAYTISAVRNTLLKFSNKLRFASSGSICRKSFHEGGHDLEKLEFALAIAQTRGDQIRSASLRAQIADLGGNVEEPGT